MNHYVAVVSMEPRGFVVVSLARERTLFLFVGEAVGRSHRERTGEGDIW